jgi:hypothetical protein
MNSIKGIAINHKTGMLWLRSPDFEATFSGMKEAKDPIKLLPIIAKSLLRKCRFAGQLSDASPQGWSVLHHSLACGEFASVQGRSEEDTLLLLMHDIGEAFYVDVPSPFKTRENTFVEAAIVRAMPYPWINGFIAGTHSGAPNTDFNYAHDVDVLSGVVEAKLFGNNWAWPKKRIKELPRKSVSTMKKALEGMSHRDPGLVKTEWIRWCGYLLTQLNRHKRVV